MQGQNYNPYTGAPLSGIDPDFGRYARRASHLRSFHSCRVGLEPC